MNNKNYLRNLAFGSILIAVVLIVTKLVTDNVFWINLATIFNGIACLLFGLESFFIKNKKMKK